MGFLSQYSQVSESIQSVGYVTARDYQIRITSDKGADIIANLPEEIGLSTGSDWDQSYNKSLAERAKDQGLISDSKSRAAQMIESQTGLSTQLKILSVATWRQGTFMQLTLPLVFRAFNNTVEDVTNKIVTLMAMAVPSEEGGILIAPGPSMLGMATSGVGGITGENITIELGSFFRLSPVIIKNVDSTILCQFDSSGDPMSSTVNITVETPFVCTKEDLYKWFTHYSGGG